MNTFSILSTQINEAYKILGIPNSSNLSDIKKAYRKKVLTTHPDKGGHANDFILVNQAFELLINLNPLKNINNSAFNNITIPKEKPKTKNKMLRCFI